MATLLGNLRVRLTAETEDFRRGLESARQNLASMQKQLDKFRNNAMANVVSIGALVGGLAHLVMSTAQAADEIDKMSIRTGISRERLQELKYVADQIGVSFEDLQGATVALTRHIPEIQAGSGPVAEAMRRIGVSVTDAKGNLKGMGELFPSVISGLAAMKNETARNATATQLFGKKAAEITPLIAAGGEELARLTQRARDLGLVMSEGELDTLVAFRDQMDEFKARMEAAGRSIVMALIPAIEQLAPVVVTMAKGVGLAVKGWQMLGATLALIPLLAQAAGTALTGHFKEASKLVDNAFAAWHESIADIRNPTVKVTPKVDVKNGPGTTTGVRKFFDSLDAEWENMRHSVKLITLEVGGTDQQKNAEEERHQLSLIAIEEQHIRAKMRSHELTAYEGQEQLRQLGIKRQIVAETRKDTDAAQRTNQQTLASREFQNTLLTDAVEKEKILTDNAVLRLDSEDDATKKIRAKLALQLSMSQKIYELQRDGALQDTTLLDTQRAAELLKLDLARQREQFQLRTLAATEEELAVVAKQRALKEDVKSGAAGLITAAFNHNLNGGEIGSTIASLGAKALGGIAAGPIGLAVAEGVGGLIGGLFGRKKSEEEQSPVVKGLDAIERAQRETITTIQAQTDALLNPENRLMNLPSDFTVPRYSPNIGGGSTTNVSQTNNISLNISVPSGQPENVRGAVRDALGDILSDQRRNQSWAA